MSEESSNKKVWSSTPLLPWVAVPWIAAMIYELITQRVRLDRVEHRAEVVEARTSEWTTTLNALKEEQRTLREATLRSTQREIDERVTPATPSMLAGFLTNVTLTNI